MTLGGRVVLDGGLTNNLPLHPVHPHTTVRVSPRWDCQGADIRPARPYPTWFSLFPRYVRRLFAQSWLGTVASDSLQRC